MAIMLTRREFLMPHRLAQTDAVAAVAVVATKKEALGRAHADAGMLEARTLVDATYACLVRHGVVSVAHASAAGTP
jgi:hypothetical protein